MKVYTDYHPVINMLHQKTKQRELMSAVNNASAFVGSSLTGTIRNPQNTVQSGRYVVGLLQSFSPN
ncbi:hypothetical protein [Enterobacter asburiae]|uniref:hypothetical protein n=1 Tax=Enterobacter asburiae TaxID=61645 RepID=UPI0007E9B856|nr:hypothetical protein [Enterobacter asburiae]OAZ95385.1 hypothetical protein A9X61_10250 [Enterobacter asburiae]